MGRFGHQRRVRMSLAVLTSVGAALAWIFLAGTLRAEARPVSGPCPILVGPRWTLTGKYALAGPATKRSGVKYALLARGITCSAALKLARTVIGAPLANRTPGVDVPMKRVPAGFTCQGRSDSFGRAYSGICFTPKRRIYFAWGSWAL